MRAWKRFHVRARSRASADAEGAVERRSLMQRARLGVHPDERARFTTFPHRLRRHGNDGKPLRRECSGRRGHERCRYGRMGACAVPVPSARARSRLGRAEMRDCGRLRGSCFPLVGRVRGLWKGAMADRRRRAGRCDAVAVGTRWRQAGLAPILAGLGSRGTRAPWPRRRIGLLGDGWAGSRAGEQERCHHGTVNLAGDTGQNNDKGHAERHQAAARCSTARRTRAVPWCRAPT